MVPENSDNYKSDEFEDAAVRRFRLLRIGARNKDHETLQAVKDDLIGEYGEILGSKVYDGLFFEVISEINLEDMKQNHGIDLKRYE